MSRFDFIKGRRARRNQEASMVVTIHDAMAKRATDAVNRIIKTVTQDSAPLALNARVLQSERTKSLKKRLKVVKADYYLLKQKVAKLQSHMTALDENDEGTTWIKEALNNVIITRIKEFDEEEGKLGQKKLHQILTTDELAYLACITNPVPPLQARTVGQLFRILSKLGVVVNIECIKPSYALIDSVGRGDAYVKYVEGGQQ